MLKLKLKGKWGKTTVAFLAVCLILAVWLFIKSDAYNYFTSPSFRGITSVKNTGNNNNSSAPPSENSVENTLQKIQQKYGYFNFFQDGDLENPTETKHLTTFPVPEYLHVLTGLNEKATYEKRIESADSLKQISIQDQEVLFSFLHKRLNEDYLPSLELNAVKNQVVVALMRQKPFNEELPLHLVSMYHDETFDFVWRDYCIQFLGQTFHEVKGKENKLAVKATILDSLKYKENMAGTGIIAFGSLARYPEISKKEIAEEAYKLASDENASSIAKVPALQIAAKYNHPESVNLARKFLKNNLVTSSNSRSSRTPAVPVILKMSAIATIGMKGNKEDIALLEKHRKSADIRLRSAAKAAIKKL